MTLTSAPCSSRRPSTVMRDVPAPSTHAPMRSSSVARHSISGSRAAFSITVVPSASVAAIMSCWVAPTDGKSSTMLAPRSRSASAST